MHDVAVVGAGPAGSAAAILLARQGVAVVLLDRAEFPREKACGDMLSRASLRALERLGLSDLIDRHWEEKDWSALFQSPGGNRIERGVSTADESGRAKWATIPRHELDAELVQAAQRAGAELIERASVKDLERNASGVFVRTAGVDGGGVGARLVIVASGSKDGLTLGQPDLFALRGYFEGQDDLDLILRFDHELLPGYQWQFPVKDGLFNIGLGLPVEQIKQARSDERLLQSDLVQRKRQVGSLKGAFLNTSFSEGIAHADRALWVGDAAGMIQPHLAEGISPALLSGEIAAQTAIECLGDDRLGAPDLALYTRRLHEEFDREMRLSRWLHRMMKRPILLDAFGRALATQHSRLFRLFGGGSREE